MKEKKLVVVGGGAAGFFCAVNAARMNPGLDVVLLEKSNKLLSKVKVSGGGRCNVTHACFDIAEMSEKYPRGKNFVKKAFHRFFTSDTVKWFEEREVPLCTEEDGRMFPLSHSSSSIIDCLLEEADKYKVDIRIQKDVSSIEKINSEFVIQLANGEIIKSDFICIATGGFSKPEQFDWIRKLGHEIEIPVPSLFTMNIPQHPITELMGVAVEDVILKVSGTKLKERGPVLITHWGLSGPAVLRLSAWGARLLHDMDYDFSIQVNWCPEQNQEIVRNLIQDYRQFNGAVFIGSKNPFDLPHRLWLFILKVSGIDNGTRWSDLSAKGQVQLIENLTNHTFHVKGKTTFKEEFVTAGGVLTSEINVQTMESKKVPGLYFAGEIINVDGITGGFNFQHAWTSGWIAAEAIARAGSK
jgi:predicted Rossmann fold flavoprotein